MAELDVGADKKGRLVFAIAKDITYRRQLEEYKRISSILGMINDDHHSRFRQPKSPTNFRIKYPSQARFRSCLHKTILFDPSYQFLTVGKFLF